MRLDTILIVLRYRERLKVDEIFRATKSISRRSVNLRQPDVLSPRAPTAQGRTSPRT
jgi:hypothetical protein